MSDTFKFDDLEIEDFPVFEQGMGQDAAQGGDDPSMIGDVAASVPRGIAGAAEGLLEAGNILTSPFGFDYDVPENFGLGKSKTGAGAVVETITQFAAGFGPIGKGLSWAGKLAKASKLGKTAKKAEKALEVGSKKRAFVKGATAGVLTDFAGFDAHDARLSELIETVPELANPITAFLASDPDDSEAMGRLKNSVEGLALGVALEPILAPMLRYMSKARKLRAEGKTPNQVNEALETEARGINSALSKSNAVESLEVKLDADLPKIEPSKQAKATVKKLIKGDEGLSLEGLMGRLARGEGPQTHAALEKLYDETGVVINLDSFTNSKAVAQEATLMVDELKGSIQGLKKAVDVNPETADVMLDELRKYGINEDTAPVFRHIKNEKERLAAITATHLTMRKFVVEPFAQNIRSARTLKERLAKAVDPVERAKLQVELEKATIIFDQHVDLFAILSAGLGQKATQAGRELRHFRTVQQADLDITEIRETLLGGKLEQKRMSKNQLEEAMEKVSDVVEKHGVGGLGNLSNGKGIIDFHNEIWMNSLLSGPKTFLVNTLGNALTAIYLPFERMIGAQAAMIGANAAEKAVLQTMRREAFSLSFHLHNLSDAFALGKKAFKDENSVIQKGSAVTDELRGPAITAQNLADRFPNASNYMTNNYARMADYFGSAVDKGGRILRIPTRFLTGTDEFFKQLTFRQHAQTEAAMKAHADLIKEYGDKGLPLTPEVLKRELPARTASHFDGLVTETGERYSTQTVRKQVYKEMLEAMTRSGKEWDTTTRQDFFRRRYDQLWDETRGGISDRAFESAQEATFTVRPERGSMSEKVEQMVQKHSILRLVMPFVRTPVNIVKFAGQRFLPFDLPGVRGVHKKLMKDLQSPDPIVAAAARGRQAAGSAMWAMTAMAVVNGRITGRGPKNHQERKILEQTGWRPYSIEANGNYYSYQRLDPFATFLGFTADMVEYTKQQTEGQIEEPETSEQLLTAAGAAWAGLSQKFINKTYMTGLKQVMDAIHAPDRFADMFIKTRAASYVPNVFGQMVGTLDGDEAIREAYTVFDYINKRSPLHASELDPRRNVLGEVIRPNNYRIPLLGTFIPDAVETYVSPIMVSSKKNDPIIAEMVKSSHAFQPPRRKKLGVDYSAVKNAKGQSAYDRWMELQGTVKINRRTLRQALQHLITSRKFQSLSDAPLDELGSPRAREMSRVLRKYRSKAEQKMLGEFDELSQKIGLLQNIKFNQSQGRDVSGLYSELDLLNDQLKGLR